VGLVAFRVAALTRLVVQRMLDSPHVSPDCFIKNVRTLFGEFTNV